ncbi:MAG: hypothetical protein ACOYY2_13015 [Actinomycetota bacterium]
MPYKEWAPQEVLTAADVNTYLLHQGIIVCTSATRPANYPVQPGDADLTEGTVIYETDTDYFRVWHETTGWRVNLLDDPGWQTPSLLNGWTNYANGYAAAGYRIDRTGEVWLKGLVRSGTGIIFTLPVGYRPTRGQLIFRVPHGATSGCARVDVDVNGNVNSSSGAANWYDLGSIRFRP